MPLHALALNCTLKSSGNPSASSTERMLALLLAELSRRQVVGEMIRMADKDVHPGVSSDEGEGDAWPVIRERILKSDILVLGTPIWLGQPSSICKRVLERLDAFLGETDDGGRMVSYGRVAMVAVVGNEDGAHHVSAELYQALNDVGFSLAPNAVSYWVGEAMQKTDFKDLETVPEAVARAAAMAAGNAAHLAALLKSRGYPEIGE
jgi:multimeric flavodoxin WrbA